MKNHNISPLENMMINLKEEGQQNVWQYIESIKDAKQRCATRRLFFIAIDKMEKRQ